MARRLCEYQTLLRCRVAYVAPSGCIFFSLPIFVDTHGSCHTSLEDKWEASLPRKESTEEALGHLSPQDVYTDNQLSLMRELEERKGMMACVLEEMMQHVRKQRRVKARSKLQALNSNSVGNQHKKIVTDRDVLIQELWDEHQCRAPAQKEGSYKEVSKLSLPSRCGYSPRGRKFKPFHLQQPRAVY